MNAKPIRVQLSRQKGWRMPPNTVKVDRSTRWGNPYRHDDDRGLAVAMFRKQLDREGGFNARTTGQGTFRTSVNDVKRELRGKHLACWCPLDQPCHADVLLELANQ